MILDALMVDHRWTC